MSSSTSSSTKTLRYMSETSKKLDEYTYKCDTVESLLQPGGPTHILRMRVKELMVRALLDPDPTLTGNRAIDLGWKKAFYEPISLSRKLRKASSDGSEASSLMETHLFHATGVFSNTLSILSSRYDVAEVRGIVVTEVGGGYSMPFQSSSKKPTSPELKEWARGAVRKILVILGDLSRYRTEFEPKQAADEGEEVEPAAHVAVAQKYYEMALEMDGWSDGAPFNQLAALATGNNAGLNSVYFYLRSWLSPVPFKGCESNLKALMEKSAARLTSNKFRTVLGSDHGGDSIEGADQNGGQFLSEGLERERCILHHIRMVQEFLFEESTENLSQVCEAALNYAQRCLYYPRGVALSQCMSRQVSNHLVIVILLTMDKVGAENQVKTSMLRAYLLALFSHMVAKLVGDLYFSLHGPEAMSDLFESEAKVIEEGDPEPESEKDEDDPSPVKSEAQPQKKKKFKDFFRRRRRRSSSSSDESEKRRDTNSSTSEDSSEDEAEPRGRRGSSGSESSRLSSRSRSFSSRRSSYSSAGGSSFVSRSSGDDDDQSDDDDDDVIVEETTDVISAKDVANLIGQHHLIQAIRLCTHWLLLSKSLLRESGETSSVLWIRLSRILNAISLNNHAYEASSEVAEAQRILTDSGRDLEQILMPEDKLIQGTKYFKAAGEEKRQETDTEFNISDPVTSGLIRVRQLQHLGQWISGLPSSRMAFKKYRTGHIIFHIKPPGEDSVEEEGDDGELLAKDDQESGGPRREVMENMAKLWLEQEVKNLEGGSGQSGKRRRGRGKSRLISESGPPNSFEGFASYTPYIVVDHLALTKNCNLLKDVVASRRFVTIVPEASVQELDRMKRTESGARNAIRWLEKQFQEGSKWVRAQKPFEHKKVTVPTSRGKSRRKGTHDKILECCHFFSAATADQENKEGAATTDDCDVTLITYHHQDGDHEGRLMVEPDVEQLAKSLRVNVCSLERFAARNNIKLGSGKVGADKQPGPTTRHFRERRGRKRSGRDEEDKGRKTDAGNG